MNAHGFGCTAQLSIRFLQDAQDKELFELGNGFRPVNSLGHHLINELLEYLCPSGCDKPPSSALRWLPR